MQVVGFTTNTDEEVKTSRTHWTQYHQQFRGEDGRQLKRTMDSQKETFVNLNYFRFSGGAIWTQSRGHVSGQTKEKEVKLPTTTVSCKMLDNSCREKGVGEDERM